MTRGVQHTKDEIINAIKAAWEKGEDLRTAAVQKGPMRWAFRSYGYYFESWKKTLAAAGISYKDVKSRAKERDRLRFLEDLAEAHAMGVDLSAAALQQGNRSLYDRSKRYYEGRFAWENALTDAGLPVEKIVRQRRWDRDKVKKEFIERRKKGKPLFIQLY